MSLFQLQANESRSSTDAFGRGYSRMQSESGSVRGGRPPWRKTAVERREAPRARSRRFAQADRSVARAAPEARAGGNIRPRGVATTFGASRRSISPFSGAHDLI